MNIENRNATLAKSWVRNAGAVLLLASVGLAACSASEHAFGPSDGGAAGDDSGLPAAQSGSAAGGTTGGGMACPSELPECAPGAAGQDSHGGPGAGGSAETADAAGGNADAAGGAAGMASVPVDVCGDGTLDPDERCDDSNDAAGDGCGSTCRIESGWNCDQGDPTHCTSICGDGLVVGPEAIAGSCDDKNQAATDGCSAACKVEAGYVCVGTPSVCAKTCGDGKLDAGEASDDGNANFSDGCRACAVEQGFGCDLASPSVCTPDPKITSFTAEYLRVCAGNSLVLSANYTNGSGTIDNAVGAVASGGSVSSKAIATKTTFTLTVASAGHPSATATVVVDVIGNGKFSPTGTFVGDRVTQLVPISDGRVVVVGSTEDGKLYDPHTETFSPLTLPSARLYPAVTELSDGRALIAGGLGVSVASATIYDPVSGMFSSTGDMNQGRYASRAEPLGNGRVLFAAGLSIMNGTSTALNTIELLNLSTGQFITNSVVMKTARWGEANVLLSSGKVLFAGGCTGTSLPSCPAVTNLAELYDPSSGAAGAFSDTGPMSAARLTPATAKLNGDKVLVAGGATTTACLDSAEVFDSSAGTVGAFSSTGTMNSPRNFATATLLGNGKVLLAGGGACSPTFNVASAELYDPTNGKFTLTGSMATDRSGHTALALANGMVLVLGGEANVGTGGTQPAPGAELYCP